MLRWYAVPTWLARTSNHIYSHHYLVSRASNLIVSFILEGQWTHPFIAHFLQATIQSTITLTTVALTLSLAPVHSMLQRTPGPFREHQPAIIHLALLPSLARHEGGHPAQAEYNQGEPTIHTPSKIFKQKGRPEGWSQLQKFCEIMHTNHVPKRDFRSSLISSASSSQCSLLSLPVCTRLKCGGLGEHLMSCLRTACHQVCRYWRCRPNGVRRLVRE